MHGSWSSIVRSSRHFVHRSPCRLPTSLTFSLSPASNAAAAAGGGVPVKKTALHDFHVARGGKMVEFAGWSMPVQYNDLSISASHLHTRKSASIFDVSHMLQTTIFGKDRVEFIESLVVGDIAGLPDNGSTLTLYTTERGGIIDDLIVTKTDIGYLYVVSNAGCSDKDLAHVMNHLATFKAKGKDVSVEVSDNSLLAVQGPQMMRALQDVTSIDLSKLYFMTSALTTIYDVPNCRITRCGYTGEDGVEISVPSNRAAYVTERLLLENQIVDVKLAGLGARDSLRLEAGLCLYGNDIDDTTTPVEAALTWTIGKRRRQEANFPGASVILKQLVEKPLKKRIGITSVGAPARGGSVIMDECGKHIGLVTSGCPSPSLKNNVAMGYITATKLKLGTKINLEVRKKLVSAEISKMPFVPTGYYTSK